MANRSLGTLTLDVVAKTGGFTSGLDKAEREAKKRAANIEKAFDTTFGIIGAGIAAMAAAGTAALAIVNQQAEGIANYQDLAEKIGDTASAIASMQKAATVSGVALDTVAAASVRLTASLSKTDDETKLVGQAIQALGLNFDDFKQLSPVDQIEAVANAMNGFADGSEKTATAVALFGKAGAELIPFLNDLADGAERQITLTDEQIKQADDYTKAQAALRAEFDLFVQQQSSELIPVLTSVQEIFAQLAKDETTVSVITETLKGIVGAAITVFQTLAIVGANVGFVLLGVGREIGAIGAQIAALATGNLAGFRAISEAVKADADRARAELDKFEKRVMSIGQPKDGLNVSGLVDQFLPQAPRISTRGFDTSSKKAAAEKISEFERYLKSLREQLTVVGALTTVEKVLGDVQSGRLGKITAAQQAQVLAVGEEVDAAKLAAEAWTFVSKAQDDAAESAQVLLLANQKLAQSYLDTIDPARAVAREMRIIDELVNSGDLTPQEGIDAQIVALKNAYKGLQDEVKTWDDYSKEAIENIQDGLGQGLVDIVNGTTGSIVDSFAQMFLKIAAEAAAADISRKLFGDLTKGGNGEGLFGAAIKNIGSFFGSSGYAEGGFTGSGGKYEPAGIVHKGEYVINARDTKRLGLDKNLNGYANGGLVSPIRGQNSGPTYVVNVTAPPNVSRQTAKQFGDATARSLNAAQRSNG